ncbi:VCBS repeat-containing protein [Xanthocytophaga agilis]|uniref:VCBS repeat-containing protein n=1 Tax=Xanthocytophaga agilis TaxID=3048010 RepID=A0AAE3UHS8_9BACT|nr:VCBS repeat-containing protein [Xanthocytophaga agilis]MDJ1505800.1 VCBS repeat-containing protein [Xanthocytophaga agilis]
MQLLPLIRKENIYLFCTYIAFFLSLLLYSGCAERTAEKQTALFESLPSSHTGITFTNRLQESQQLNIVTFEYFYNGGGVGILDINNDGLMDVVLGGNMVPSRLYLNKGDFRFEDITIQAGMQTQGWVSGISVADVNADGYMDIYLCKAGPYRASKPDRNTRQTNELYINQKNNTFKEQAQQYGLNFTGHTTQAAFFDYDRDGDLDCYLLTNVMESVGPNIIRPKVSDGSSITTDRLYCNNGDQTFSDVSLKAGIVHQGYGLGLAITDINQDGWLDVYVSNDYLSNDLLYINQQNGTFTEEASVCFKHQSYSAMGNDAADIDNDGLVDIVTVDMLPASNERRKLMLGSMNYDRHLAELRAGYAPQYVRNTLQHNNGNGTFSEIGRLAGIHATDWSWAPLLADFDNDGYKDLLVTNGYPKDITNRDFALYRMEAFHSTLSDAQYRKQLSGMLTSVKGALVPNHLFKGSSDMLFSDQSEAWGMSEPSYSNGAAYADLDNDGDLDLVINNIDREAFVYRNRLNEKSSSEKSVQSRHHFLRIVLTGEGKNTQGYGAKVDIFYGRQHQFFEQSPLRGYQSSVDPVLHVGLGNIDQVDSLIVTWPDGKKECVRQLRADRTRTLSAVNAHHIRQEVKPAEKVLFTKAPIQMDLDYKHTDEPYIDFKIQPLLLHLLSQQGPGLAVGDMDQNGLEDFYVGGAFNHSGRLFFQHQGGTFKHKPLVMGKKYEEDEGVLLFDADGDKDLDLFVVSGSSEFAPGSAYYQDRLYHNDGKGNFTLTPDALPRMRSSGTCVSAADYDRDGDLDLFVGGSVIPTRYPFSSKSYILRNDKGRFIDVTYTLAPELTSAGMVSSALWTDFDQDGWMDLILAGEWMPITFYHNLKGRFVNVTEATGLIHTHGLWNSITAADFDGDNDTDYVLGNLGLNNEYHASAQRPLVLYANDFDQNGVVDPVIFQVSGDTHKKNDSLYPVHSRDEMISQMNYLRKRFPAYAPYARATLADIFSVEEQKAASVFSCERLESVYIENKGKGKFALAALPLAAQVSPVFGMVSGDYDGDSYPDLLLIGNSYATESITGCYDASGGLLLKGNGKGKFIPVPAQKSGFWVDKDAKALAEVCLSSGKKILLATQNNDSLKTFLVSRPSGKRVFTPQALDAWAELRFPSGRVQRLEFYYGSSYLSQSTRSYWIEASCQLTVYDFQGKARKIIPTIALNKHSPIY